MASKHDIAKRSNKGTLRPLNLGSLQFFRLLLEFEVFEGISFLKISSCIQTLSTVMQLFKGSCFLLGAASRHF